MSRAFLGVVLFVAAVGAVCAGPVTVYREGAQYCPRDRASDAPELTQPEVVARARALLPKDFCGPTPWVTGCDFDPELIRGSWRVFVQQYDDRGGRKDPRGLDHNYVILDRVGNCFANIPGTELGAPN